MAHPCAERETLDEWTTSLTVDGVGQLFYRRHLHADPRLSRDARVATGLKRHVTENTGTKNGANPLNDEKGCASEIPRSLGQPRADALKLIMHHEPLCDIRNVMSVDSNANGDVFDFLTINR